ncbi:phosphoribosylformylglycinamidine synthase, partial [Patescibacteria group bacterium]|nr:phosphoribosylformylglycinamidine synthase [Patescibacteria group bacterium]
IEIGFLPGVTDNIATTARESIEDLLKTKFIKEENVYSSKLFFLKGNIVEKEVFKIAESLYNPLIERMHLKDFRTFVKDSGMDFVVPRVNLIKTPNVIQVDLDVTDEELAIIGKSGITGPDGIRRGPLALDLTFMRTIQAYFKKMKRKPNDIELESLAQSWSEHCKHTIFADPIDELKDGLYKTYIKGATEEIRRKKGNRDFCVSVFTDNSGGIIFDDEFMVTHKVETHNSPSALDPFGGAVTGIVGVNRDTIGFGLGAKPVANFYGFCFADPRIDIALYKGKNKTQKMLSGRRIMDGVIAGVNSGGNQSGIPTPQGFVYFDKSFAGKPLVFVGTVGLIPRKIKGHKAHLKKAQPGDYIVMVGGRVGKDGIHGATFSSEALDTGSPATAVQLGDPITQKKLSDALIKEARNTLLYNSITDNGAGGLSCSVSEMARESGGCIVELEKVPLKYPHLEPWEIWVSESQERMTLAVPEKNWTKFSGLMKRRGVEATVIGKFTDSGKCAVRFKGQKIMELDMDFLHNGLPKRPMKTKMPVSYSSSGALAQSRSSSRLPSVARTIRNFNQLFLQMLSRPNITSFEFISRQYDHIVQGNAVLGPLQGRGRVNADTSVIRPVLSSQKGVILSQALYPAYSEIDTYNMAASSIDTAIRNAVAAGANPDYISLLDNFCWCSANEPERLYQLKLAAKACFDFAIAYETPFISGKDSMFNDFKGFDKDGLPIKISILPTLLISSFGVIDDITKVVSPDAKMAGDLVYLLGETFNEMCGSEYLAMLKEKDEKEYSSQNIPAVSVGKNRKLYSAVYTAIQKDLIASSISIRHGGLGVALARKAIGGMLGVSVSSKNIPGMVESNDVALYSESQGRILVTVAPANKVSFEKIMKGNSYALIGKVTKEPVILIKGLKGKEIINLSLKKAVEAYRETFKDY